MAVIASDGLSLLVGDGATTEVFSPLKGATLNRLDIQQRSFATSRLGGDAWMSSVGTAARQATLECDALATDETAATRLRSLALSGSTGNFKLNLNISETLVFSAVVLAYRETIEPGGVKRLRCTLESSGSLSVA